MTARITLLSLALLTLALSACGREEHEAHEETAGHAGEASREAGPTPTTS
jgi:hypothetical protein